MSIRSFDVVQSYPCDELRRKRSIDSRSLLQNVQQQAAVHLRFPRSMLLHGDFMPRLEPGRIVLNLCINACRKACWKQRTEARCSKNGSCKNMRGRAAACSAGYLQGNAEKDRLFELCELSAGGTCLGALCKRSEEPDVFCYTSMISACHHPNAAVTDPFVYTDASKTEAVPVLSGSWPPTCTRFVALS